MLFRSGGQVAAGGLRQLGNHAGQGPVLSLQPLLNLPQGLDLLYLGEVLQENHNTERGKGWRQTEGMETDRKDGDRQEGWRRTGRMETDRGDGDRQDNGSEPEKEPGQKKERRNYKKDNMVRGNE